MSPITDLTISYHQQDNEYCCGAACAQMLLVSDAGAGPLGGTLDPANTTFQQTESGAALVGLWGNILNAMTNLKLKFGRGAHPQAVAKVLNDHKSSAYSDIEFQVFKLPTPEEICSLIVHTIEEYGIPPVVLVLRGRHWVTVTGCNYNVLTTPANGIEIVDFLIQNSSPVMETGVSNDHSPTDGCGNGAVLRTGQQDTIDYKGCARYHIPYDTWRCIFMAEPVPKKLRDGTPTGDLADCFVAVCPVKAGDTGPKKLVSTSICAQVPTSTGSLDTPTNKNKAIDSALAYLGASKYGLSGRTPWNDFVARLNSDLNRQATFDGTQHVQHTDNAVAVTTEYYLVPIMLASGSMPGMVRVRLNPTKIASDPTGLSGFEPLDSVAVPPGCNVVAIADLDDIASGGIPRLSMRLDDDRRIPDIPRPYRGLFIPFRTAVEPGFDSDPIFLFALDLDDLPAASPTLVWEPSRQSFSPFVPFYRFHLGRQYPDLPYRYIYLRADFQVVPAFGSENKFIAKGLTGFTQYDTEELGI